MTINKGIILAGGSGSRLYPLSKIASKQLQPIYDKPMVYYPLTTLIENGVDDICLISTPQDLPRFENLLGNGERFGIRMTYREQAEPKGIAQAFIIADDLIRNSNVALILGDNILHGYDFRKDFESFNNGAKIFAFHVKNPDRYGVVEFNEIGKAISIEEKPLKPKSNYAVPGLYLYDKQVVHIAKDLKPSARNELEITDLNNVYLKDRTLNVGIIPKGSAWLDAGTPESFYDANSYVHALEARTGLKIGCPEEAAFKRGFLNEQQLDRIIKETPKCEYRSYLENILNSRRN